MTFSLERRLALEACCEVLKRLFLYSFHATADGRAWNSMSGLKMRAALREKMIEICDAKIRGKGEGVGLSFYAFFSNKNDEPELLMEAATWWIQTRQLDHFEKAVKIKQLVERDSC